LKGAAFQQLLHAKREALFEVDQNRSSKKSLLKIPSLYSVLNRHKYKINFSK